MTLPLLTLARATARGRGGLWLCATLVGLSLTGCGDNTPDETPTPADPCANISCDTPPDPTCEGDIAVTHDATGACQAGDCAYQATRLDCALSGQACVSGACQDITDPCANISCDTPPDPTCEGDIAVTHDATGACQGGDCAYQEARTDCAEDDLLCRNGACVAPDDPCAQISCDAPPAPSCEGDVALTHSDAGTCQEGSCAYQQTRTDCAEDDKLCQAGACVDPCANVSCDAPPAPTCEGDVAVTHSDAGMCQGGDCAYQETRTDCAEDDKLCSNGACVAPADPCANVSCDMPPAPTCDGEVAVTHAAVGMCQAGQCDYQETRTDCAAMDHFCQAGACVDPCAGISCDMPPAPSCMDDVAITHDAAGMCQGGACSYQAQMTTCAVTHQRCDAGACIEATKLAAGRYHVCALRPDHTVACWGNNADGQLGDGTTTSRFTPTPVSGLSDAVSLAAGEDHTCALRQDGSVVCWGRNQSGQLGDNTSTNSLTPTPVSGLSDAIELAGGNQSNCARRQGGQVVCWGANFGGMLGDGTSVVRRVPTPVIGLSDAVALSVSYSHTCALRQDGSVACWGSNHDGQLGDGTTTNRNIPTAVLGLTDAVEVVAGGLHTCARLQDSSVVCWGRNADGQLGDGTTITRAAPTPVSGLSDAVEIDADYNHTCARRQGGQVVCWGRNLTGELGDGTTTQSATPTPASGLTDARQLSAGHSKTCARRQDNSVVCWGNNASGQLGDGTYTHRNTPTPVVGL